MAHKARECSGSWCDGILCSATTFSMFTDSRSQTERGTKESRRVAAVYICGSLGAKFARDSFVKSSAEYYGVSCHWLFLVLWIMYRFSSIHTQKCNQLLKLRCNRWWASWRLINVFELSSFTLTASWIDLLRMNCCRLTLLCYVVDVLWYLFARYSSWWCLAFQVGSVIRNPEIAALVPTLLISIADPNEHTKTSLDLLLQARSSFRPFFHITCIYSLHLVCAKVRCLRNFLSPPDSDNSCQRTLRVIWRIFDFVGSMYEI